MQARLKWCHVKTCGCVATMLGSQATPEQCTCSNFESMYVMSLQTVGGLMICPRCHLPLAGSHAGRAATCNTCVACFANWFVGILSIVSNSFERPLSEWLHCHSSSATCCCTIHGMLSNNHSSCLFTQRKCVWSQALWLNPVLNDVMLIVLVLCHPKCLACRLHRCPSMLVQEACLLVT